ncbi:MAG TPA: hypothetical protein VFR03_02085 [Thermoanaerobaculia bacterium]|nr:hypothetical protein [Thermoanaerobaculia bacterium]
MLSSACRRFRARFSPGSAHPHRRACPECEAFAAALESAAGIRLPLPESLRRNLRAIAGPEPGAALPFAVPRLPVPDALARRLRTIAPAGRPPLSEWVRSPRYAVAASAILALLLGPALSRAAHRSLDVLDTVHARVSPLVRGAEAGGREEIAKLRSRAIAAGIAAGNTARRSVESSLERFDERLSGLSTQIFEAVPENLINQDPRHERAGSVRRPQ